MKTVAFVPLRLNSQRVAGKNLRLLGGEPLMCHILRTLAGIRSVLSGGALTVYTQFYAVLALPLIYLPLRTGIRVPKYVSYLFYPAHLALIYLLTM